MSDRLAALLRDQVHHLLRRIRGAALAVSRGADVADHDPDALAREVERFGATESVGCARDYGDLPFQSRHASPLP